MEWQLAKFLLAHSLGLQIRLAADTLPNGNGRGKMLLLLEALPWGATLTAGEDCL